MRPMNRIVLLLTLILALALPGTAMAAGFFEDRVVFGDTFTLERGKPWMVTWWFLAATPSLSRAPR